MERHEAGPGEEGGILGSGTLVRLKVSIFYISHHCDRPYSLNFPKINLSLCLNSRPGGWQQIQRETAETTATQGS